MARKAIPLPFEARRPAGQEVRLVEEDDRPPPLGRHGLGVVPEPVPKPREGGLGAVARGVDRDRPELGRERQEHGRLPNLPRAGDDRARAREAGLGGGYGTRDN
jgi:hypothetical protein